ncbi:glutathione S-transferase family protein [Celerinatantimonas sp. YJH-8]|uniref:glutathione S-transferase family protein n=1 Tax=Celerinatantimonas sp. YJH-8 TaxID=3228714 RepID=UPI0038C94A9A
MYSLHIANKNYSSWSLRPWVLLKALNIPFLEIVHPFGDKLDWENYQHVSPSRLVPCLVTDKLTVWDSLAIIEYLAEKHPGVWAEDEAARAWSRSVSAQMHSGFMDLRRICSMNCGVSVKLNAASLAELATDISRIDALWQYGLSTFKGPFLAGEHFTAVDAFYAPVVFRFQSFGISLSAESEAYLQRMLQFPAMQLWYEQALNEPYRDAAHEDEINRVGCLIEDRR